MFTTVIVEQAPKSARKATGAGFGVTITQKPTLVGRNFEAVAYVGEAKISVSERSESQAWAMLKAGVEKNKGQGTVALAERKRTTDYSTEWGKIEAAKEDKKGTKAEAEPETEQPAAETEQPVAAGGRRGGR